MLKGLNDTVIVKTKTQTSDNRGGVTSTLTTKIASLACSVQPVRREEVHFDASGQIVIDPTLLVFDNIASGPEVEEGDIISHNSTNYYVISCGTTSGKGTHTECIMREINNQTYVN